MRSSRLLGAAAVLAAAVVVGASDTAHAATSVTIQADRPIYLVDQGSVAHVGVRLTTAGNVPTGADITVQYSVASGGSITIGAAGANQKTLPDTATAGSDYTPTSGTLTFPAGTASGTVKTFDVTTIEDTSSPERAETVTANLTAQTSDATNWPVTTPNTPPTVVINAHGYPYLNSSLPIATRVNDLLSRMSEAEKVGQMTQPERAQFTTNAATSNTNNNFVSAWLMGSILSGGGSWPGGSLANDNPQGWADSIDDYQLRALRTPLQIPLVYGIDSVHGDNNLAGATIFPHNIGMGATRDPDLAEQEGHIAATETRATGPQWAFAPCVCVARDDRWGRTYESYSEDPALVDLLETSIDGLQGTTPTAKSANDRVLATAKHFAGDGGTRFGTGSGSYNIDQGVTITSQDTFERLFVTPYIPAVQVHHVGSIMPSYSSVDYTDDGTGNPVKMSAFKPLLTDRLKDQIGFDGFLISDYDALNQIQTADSSNGTPQPTPLQVSTSINAGMDMVMVPNAYRTFETNLTADIDNGTVPMARIDDAVRRILTQKFELGLFEHPFTQRDFAQVGAADHRAVARRAAAESQVLLKNEGGVLPLSTTGKIYVAGVSADNLGNQNGGWTLDWQGASGNTRTANGVTVAQSGTSILNGMKQLAPGATITYSADASAPMAGYDVGVVVVGEVPYAEGQGDFGSSNHPNMTMALGGTDYNAVNKVCGAMKCVVLMLSGRPLFLYNQLNLPNLKGLVASFLPGGEGSGVADVLFGARPFTGRLPVTWPRSVDQEPINLGDSEYNPQWPYGWGLRTDASKPRLQAVRNTLAGSSDSHLQAAARALDRILSAPDWSSSGAVTNPSDVFDGLQAAANELAATQAASYRTQDDLVSVARDIAQAAMIAGTAAADADALSAQADHELAAGNPDTAVTLLRRAATAPQPPATLAPAPRPSTPARPMVVKLSSSRIRATHKRLLGVRLSCPPSTATRCRGQLRAVSGHNSLANRSFSIAPDRTTTVHLKVNHRDYRKLVKRGRLRVSLTLVTRGVDGVLRWARTRITVLAPKR